MLDVSNCKLNRYRILEAVKTMFEKVSVEIK